MQPRFLYALFVLLSVLMAMSARAQLSGSIGITGEATNNVQSLDTTAPDQIILPAFTLSYDLPAGGSSKFVISGSMGPSIYAVNPALSYNASAIGVTGQFYLSNLEAIAATNEDSKLQEFDQLHPARSTYLRRAALPSPSPIHLTKALDNTDSLVDVASSALYTLSGELDSSDIVAVGLTKKRVSELEDLRDSISDAISTVADLLDSVGYSESMSNVIIKELEGLRAPLASVLPRLEGSRANSHLLDIAIDALQSAKPENDYLASPVTPMGAQASASTDLNTDGRPSPKQSLAATLMEAASPSAPLVTLVNSTTPLRDFGYGDISVREDLDDSSATTMAARLTTPISYSSHKALSFSKSDLATFGGDTSLKGNPNDNTTFALGAAIGALPSTSFGLRGAYDYSKSHYPFDSVYSNTENRFTVTAHAGIGPSTVLLVEGALGYRNYTSPLQVTRQVQYDSIGKFGKKIPRLKDTSVAAASKFHQFSYGFGVSQFLGERFVIGGLVAFNNNPNLRAYVTSAAVQTGPKGRKVRAAVQIADDEYTYDLSRFTVFSSARLFWDADLGCDISYESRTYGSAVGPNGNPIQGGQGRTQTGVYTNISLSKLLPFSDRVLTVFNAAIFEARLNFASVTSSDTTYGYNASVFSFGATLTF